MTGPDATGAGDRPPAPHLHEASALALPPATLYAILRLRSEVFVVEQDCAYLDLDGRDLEPDATWLWAESAGRIRATLRLLWDSPDTARIGRVATAPDARSAGLAGRLMDRALELARARPARTVVLDAQSPLVGWYARYGFARTGPEYIEDGIAHVPMARTYPDRHGH